MKLKTSLEVFNLGLLPEVKASMDKVASSMLAVLKQYSQLDFSGIQKSLEQYAKTTTVLRPAQKNMAELAKGLSVLIDTEILSANKSANKSADSGLVSANNDKLTEKQREMMEYMIQDLVEIITEEQRIEFDVTLAELFQSQIYEKIMDEETGLYRESPSYVYGLYQDEMNFGRIVQAEI